MILPFVRELMADLEHSDAFERVRRHLAGGTGRRRVSGLTATARALILPYLVRARSRRRRPRSVAGFGQQGSGGAACGCAGGVRADRRAGCERGAAAAGA